MFAQLLFSGLALGSMYALVALGYNITYATSKTVNFSQGQSVMVGAVVAYALYVSAGWPFALALAVTLVALAVVGVLVERIAVRPFLRSASIAWLLATIALGIIAETVRRCLFGMDARAFPSALATTPWMILGAGVYPHELLVPVVGIALMVAVELGFRRTLAGKALLAVAFSHEAAGLMGIDVNRTITAAYALSSLLAGVAGVLLAPLLNVSATMGTTIGLKAFAVAIIGGMESPRGIVVTAGLNILAGASGQVSLGQAGFYALGAYASAIITTRLGLGFWIGLPAAIVLGAAVGVVLALASLRVSGPYLAMVTIAFGIIVEHGLIEWDALTQGFGGIASIPRPRLGALELTLPFYFYVVALTVVVSLLLARNLERRS